MQMQIKTTLRFYVINYYKENKQKMLVWIWERGSKCWWECKFVQQNMGIPQKSIWVFLKKLEEGTAVWPIYIISRYIYKVPWLNIRALVLGLWMTIFSLCHGLPLVCIFVLSPLLIKDISHVGLGPYTITPPKLSCLSTDPICGCIVTL